MRQTNWPLVDVRFLAHRVIQRFQHNTFLTMYRTIGPRALVAYAPVSIVIYFASRLEFQCDVSEACLSGEESHGDSKASRRPWMQADSPSEIELQDIPTSDVGESIGDVSGKKN